MEVHLEGTGHAIEAQLSLLQAEVRIIRTC